MASTAVEMTASASGAHNELCSEGKVDLSAVVSHFALGTPPTQKIVLCFDLSASQKRLKSSAAITGFGTTTRSPPKCEVNSAVRCCVCCGVLKVASADGCSISTL